MEVRWTRHRFYRFLCDKIKALKISEVIFKIYLDVNLAFKDFPGYLISYALVILFTDADRGGQVLNCLILVILRQNFRFIRTFL